MGKDPVEERERSNKRRSERKRRSNSDWASASGDAIIRAICAAGVVGGALRFGYSRDGGAFAIGVYGDGEPYTDFVGGGENIDDYLEDYVKLFEEIADDRASATKRKISGDKLP